MTSKASRGRAGGGDCTQTRTRYNESSSFSNNLMKRESFRASRGMGENEFRQGLKCGSFRAPRRNGRK